MEFPAWEKTSTAETVAEYTQRPLFALTCGDIGDNASDVQESLEQNFSLAHRWGCVMLIDEADVFLQARSKDDLKRNAVVSVFLRVLEYYSGILILTTNKVGTFDEAFRSRIHVSLYYQQLDRESTLQIWRNNLSRLAQSRTDLKIDEEKLMEWVEREWKRSEKQARNSGRRHRPWNGRQIHNACQTAAALAAFQAGTDDSSKGTLTTKNFNTVAKASREFDSYLQATHFADGIELAAKGGYRGDDAYNASEHQTNYPASMQNGFLPSGMRLGAYPQQPISQQHMGYQQQSTQDQSGRHQKNKQTRSRSGSRKVRASTKPAKSVKTAVHEVSNEEETGEDDDTVDDTDYSDDEE